MKLAVNAVVFGLSSALSEALVLAERAGIDRRFAYDVVASGTAACHLDLAEKDLRLITELADSSGPPWARPTPIYTSSVRRPPPVPSMTTSPLSPFTSDSHQVRPRSANEATRAGQTPRVAGRSRPSARFLHGFENLNGGTRCYSSGSRQD
ncbi:MAG: hypothetical protein H0V36_12310 [Chloroflexi bacterium]|nr:hypothetical protein [Chloroflexota bacterium]